jgi:hypothetical protein
MRFPSHSDRTRRYTLKKYSVTVVLQCCYSDVPMMIVMVIVMVMVMVVVTTSTRWRWEIRSPPHLDRTRRCFTRVLQWCYSGAAVLLFRCYSVVTMMIVMVMVVVLTTSTSWRSEMRSPSHSVPTADEIV